MGTGKPTGFAMRVRWVWVWCPICRPAPTLYPPQVTHGFSHRFPRSHTRVVVSVLHLSYTIGKSITLSPARHLSPPHRCHLQPALTHTLTHPVQSHPCHLACPHPCPHPCLPSPVPAL